MSREDLQQIIALPLEADSKLQVARDYFLFSYYGQEMNFRDMEANHQRSSGIHAAKDREDDAVQTDVACFL